MPRTPSRTRLSRAFTLIELLAVIAIISILAAMTLSLTGFVQNSRKEARARGEIKLLEVKLEEFKSRFGDYPMAESTSEAEWERTLYNALSGRWTYARKDGKLVWNKTREGESQDKLNPLIETGKIGTDVEEGSTNAATKFVDPWGNAYRFRYGKFNASTGKPDNNWDRAGFLLISAGSKFSAAAESESKSVLPDKDFFSDGMESSGIVRDTYFDDEYRADNLTNFGTK